MGWFSKREVVPLDQPVADAVSPQVSLGSFANYYKSLEIVRQCIREIADQINSARPYIVDQSGTELPLPSWLVQPSTLFKFRDLVFQCCYMLHAQDRIDLLASGRSNPPEALYVGSAQIIQSPADQKVQVFDGAGLGSSYIKADRIAIGWRSAVPGVGSIANSADAYLLLEACYEAHQTLHSKLRKSFQTDVMFSHEGEAPKGAVTEFLRTLAKKHVGARNAYTPLVTDRTWKVTKLEESNRENMLVELIELISRRIVVEVFGLEPLAMGISAQQGGGGSNLTYTNASSLRSQQWVRTAGPIARIIADTMSEFLPDGQRLRFDASDLLRGSPMDRAQLAANMASANGQSPQAPYFTRDEIREVVGLGNA